ncbi:MAG: zinc-binding dehydrogenase, partial [Dehalococcoidales bacterium]|nr:zinc-binding dehydrogenase [Dehalococcoidales bacterium]
ICGSDIHRWKMGTEFVGFSWRKQQAGEVWGHELSGEVMAVGDKVAAINKGDRVVVTGVGGNIDRPGGFTERIRVPNAVVGKTIFPLPDNISFEEGALVEPMTVGLNAARRAKPKFGDTVVILGAGVIGQGAMQGFRAMGATKIIVSEVGQKRLEMAKALGADIVINAREEDPVKRVLEITSSKGADIVAECAGQPVTFVQAMDMVRDLGTVTIPALYEQPVQWLPNSVILRNINIVTGLSGDGRMNFFDTIELLRTHKFNCKPLISHEFSLDKATEAFETHLKSDESIKIIFKP